MSWSTPGPGLPGRWTSTLGAAAEGTLSRSRLCRESRRRRFLARLYPATPNRPCAPSGGSPANRRHPRAGHGVAGVLEAGESVWRQGTPGGLALYGSGVKIPLTFDEGMPYLYLFGDGAISQSRKGGPRQLVCPGPPGSADEYESETGSSGGPMKIYSLKRTTIPEDRGAGNGPDCCGPGGDHQPGARTG